MQIPQNIIDKAQKALNLKEGAEAVGNINEAAAASKILHDILMKYNMDLAMVQANQVAKKANVGKVEFTTTFDKRETDWVTKLYNAVAENFMCKILVRTESRILIVGHQENTEFVGYACEQLIAKIRIGEKLCWQAYTGQEKRGMYRRGFFNGAVSGIWHKLRQANNEVHIKDNPYAVMVVSKEQELTEWLIEHNYMRRPKTQEQIQKESDEWAAKWNAMSDQEKKKLEKEAIKWDKMRSKRKGPRRITSQDGLDEGYKTGTNLSINKGVDGASNKGNLN